jgi:hypothetical protein
MATLDHLIFADSFSELSADGIQENVRLLEELWGSAEPQIDVRRGAVNALVVRPAAALLEAAKQAFAGAGNHSNLALLLNGESDQSRELLDEFSENYCVTRRIGAKASGRIRLVFGGDGYRTIGLTTQFSANGITFLSGSIRQASPAGQQNLSGGEVFRKMPDESGYFFFDISVTAKNNGSAGNLVRGAELAMVDPLPGFIRAVVLETFTGGEDDETNESLIRRMVLGVSAKVLSSRVNMRAALLERFPDIRDSSVIGSGDPEMTRDKHSVFPGSTGGYADWYVGTTRQLATMDYVTDQITPMFHSPEGWIGYAVYITGDQIPCLYSVLSVQNEETLEYLVIDQQGCLLRDGVLPSVSGVREDSNAPMIYEDAEGVFSAYSYAAVQIRSRTPLTKVRVTASYAPQITEIQNWVLTSGQSPLGLDILVKAAIPTTIRFSAVLHTPAGENTADSISPLQNLIAEHINHLPFNGLLAVSGLLALLHNNLPAGSFVTIPALFAQTLLPNGETVFSQTSDRLVINFPPYVSNRTTLFFCNPADISFEQRFL